ncbi:putative DEAD/DEAH box helicase [Corynebacterium renale]|uniref:SNF2-related protein n=1 Tax=Corynebacterium renale TaxID=1724 RepID=UPI000DA295F4|nr:SNF2-related protein [Corynebacterium renale]SQG64555.1 putative DEAD/DEAH box helicase [Corynebacterium renale]STC95566.1 putative DEAD/DEAH box helicase [Corynebacterium renale]
MTNCSSKSNPPGRALAEGKVAFGANLSPHQVKYFAHELERSYANDHVGKLAGLLFDAQVEPKPHQIEAALFALKANATRGVILADEVGLGKTIEAGIVITQYWAERKRKILIITPASLRQQWKQELHEKFFIPSELLDAKSKASLLSGPEQGDPQILIASYEFVQQNKADLVRAWDLVVVDEAHRLRNFYKGPAKAKVASSVGNVLDGANKIVLLTATPLQNRLEEIYGLVSIFDPEYFRSLEVFRERYVKAGGGQFSPDDLAHRVGHLTKRTLRRDAEKYIRFTKRDPLTVKFQPSKAELELYDLVNSYLQRETLYAFSKSQRALSSQVIRKRLGSSTYAVGITLRKTAQRLSEELAMGGRRGDDLPFVGFDSDILDEDQAAYDSFDTNLDTRENWSDPEKRKQIQLEIDELNSYATLAESIHYNQKSLKLGVAIERGFEKLREVGAPEKAIIFTEYTDTQRFLAETLRGMGYGKGLVLFNGQNDSPEATQIYRDWLEKNSGSDVITGNPSADRRKALVDYFRDSGSIMIATEAASEGINLQFCSMLINYDLPWNPQRVEQRIGRIHRFGQKYDVVIVNFFNEGNVAEARILELLADKFHLFDSVFGASDEVLGRIESGFDFTQEIARIYDNYRTADQIHKAFTELEEKYADTVSQDLAEARAKVFDNLDPAVRDRLKSYDKQSGKVLNKFEQLLLLLTINRLQDYATFDGDGRNFTLHTEPHAGITTGHYHFKSSPSENSRQYLYRSDLAKYVIDSAMTTDTPRRTLVFNLGMSDRVSSRMKGLAGRSGSLTVRELTFTLMAGSSDVSESYLLATGRTIQGETLDQEDIAEMMDLWVAETKDAEIPPYNPAFTRPLKAQRQVLERKVKQRNSRYYNEQEELLESRLLDLDTECRKAVRELEKTRKALRKQANQVDDPMEQLRLKKKSRDLNYEIYKIEDQYRKEKRDLRDNIDEMLILISQSLKNKHREKELFTINWQITA